MEKWKWKVGKVEGKSVGKMRMEGRGTLQKEEEGENPDARMDGKHPVNGNGLIYGYGLSPIIIWP